MADKNTEILTHPYRVFRYKVEIDSITSGAFSEVSGFDLSVDVVEYRVGNSSRTTMQKVPGLTKFGNITLKRGVLGELDSLEWVLSVASSGTAKPTGIQRRNVTITLLDDDGGDGPKWEIVNAWPASYRMSDMNASSSEIAFESIELAHEGFTRIEPKGSTADNKVGSILKYQGKDAAKK